MQTQQLSASPALAFDRPSFAGRPSRLSLVGTDGSYPSLFDLLVLQATESGLVHPDMPMRSMVRSASITDPKTKLPRIIFANEAVFGVSHWRMLCTERSLDGKLGMTFVLLEQRGSSSVYLFRATSPGVSETGSQIRRWVFGRTKYFSDSHFMTRVCEQIDASWLLDMKVNPSSRLIGNDLVCQHSDFALGLFSTIVDTMALAFSN